MGTHPDSAYYPVAPSCQIPGLSAIYLDVFGRRTDGTFVEVGAFDGELVSNTSGLADLGWRGLYIEPVADYAGRCRQRHEKNPKTTVVNCAVGDVPGRFPIQIAHAFSSFHDDMIQGSREIFDHLAKNTLGSAARFEESFAGKTELVEVRRLDSILIDHDIQPGFDLLVVDVEGHEVEVFNSFDLSRWKPKMIIAELEDLHPIYSRGRPQIQQLRIEILKHGYEHLFVDETNTIFGLSEAA